MKRGPYTKRQCEDAGGDEADGPPSGGIGNERGFDCGRRAGALRRRWGADHERQENGRDEHSGCRQLHTDQG